MDEGVVFMVVVYKLVWLIYVMFFGRWGVF